MEKQDPINFFQQYFTADLNEKTDTGVLHIVELLFSYGLQKELSQPVSYCALLTRRPKC